MNQKLSPANKQRLNVSVIEYGLTVVVAWLIPGAGHFLLGYRVRGAVLCISILALFWTGEAVFAKKTDSDTGETRFLAVSFEVNKVLSWVQVGNGLSTLVANGLWGDPERLASSPTIDRDLPPFFHLGILLTLLAGLLNLLLVVHIADPDTWAEAKSGGPPLSVDPSRPSEAGTPATVGD